MPFWLRGEFIRLNCCEKAQPDVLRHRVLPWISSGRRFDPPVLDGLWWMPSNQVGKSSPTTGRPADLSRVVHGAQLPENHGPQHQQQTRSRHTDRHHADPRGGVFPRVTRSFGSLILFKNPFQLFLNNL